MTTLNMDVIHPEWQPLIQAALSCVDSDYLKNLEDQNDWLPGPGSIFNAFSQPLSKTRYILFGESPYPRAQSANGYAFWDASVHELWSNGGLSREVNRATSLRNFIKMLLVADGALSEKDTTQPAISKLDKSHYIKTNDELFQSLLGHGFLLLNATPVLTNDKVHKDAKAWHPFIEKLLTLLAEQQPQIELILFGKIAQLISDIPAAKQLPQLQAEHPYNLTFINNPEVLKFFKPLNLLAV